MTAPFTVDGLTDRQRRFVAAYQGNATQAARAAGYGGNDNTLAVRGVKLLANERVRAALARLGRLDGMSPPATSTSSPAPAPESAAPRRWAPQPGPQTAFAETTADIAIYGGSAGSGKSMALLYEGAKWTHVRGYRGVMFRRTSPELTGGGGLWDESREWYPLVGGRSRQTPHLEWLFPAGARIEFRHLQREKDVEAHHGRQYAFVGFDELTTFTERQFWYLVSRLRSTCGVRPYLRATCNPDPDSFVAELVAWWLDEDGYPIPERAGVVRWLVRQGNAIAWYDTREAAVAAIDAGGDVEPLSFTFIPGRLADNAALLEADPGYRSRLKALARVDRMRLLGDEQRGGNWKVRASAGMVLRAEDFRIADHAPSKILRTVRAWDKGASAPSDKNPDPDWTRGVRVSLCETGELWIDDLVSMRERPAVVLQTMRRTAEGIVDEATKRVRVPGDGQGVIVGLWQEVGASGIVDMDVHIEALAGYPIETVRIGVDKLAYAKVWSPRLEDGKVLLKRAPWNRELLDECDGFPEAPHDDIVDAISLAAQVLLGQGLGFWAQVTAAADHLRRKG